MSNKPDSGPNAAVSRFAHAFVNWWRRSTELRSLPQEELDRIAGELGMERARTARSRFTLSTYERARPESIRC